MTWFIKRIDHTGDPDTITLGIFNRKNNFGRQGSPFGLELAVESDEAGVLSRVRLRKTDVADIDELAPALPLWQRIRHQLKAGPMTIARLAEEIGAKVDSIEKAAKRKSNVFARVHGNDGVYRLALVERRVS